MNLRCLLADTTAVWGVKKKKKNSRSTFYVATSSFPKLALFPNMSARDERHFSSLNGAIVAAPKQNDWVRYLRFSGLGASHLEQLQKRVCFLYICKMKHHRWIWRCDAVLSDDTNINAVGCQIDLFQARFPKSTCAFNQPTKTATILVGINQILKVGKYLKRITTVVKLYV